MSAVLWWYVQNYIAIVFLETGFQQNMISGGFLISFDKDEDLADFCIEFYVIFIPCANEVEWGGGGGGGDILVLLCPSICPPVHLSVDQIMSALYLPQY